MAMNPYALFPALLSLGVCLALVYPPALTWFSVSANVTLGIALVAVGMAFRPSGYLDALTPGDGLRGFLLGLVSGSFVWPLMCGIAAFLFVVLDPIKGFDVIVDEETGAVVSGLASSSFMKPSLEVAIGFALLGACPPGTASNLVYAHITGGDLATVALLAAIATPLAVWTFPGLAALVSYASVELAAELSSSTSSSSLSSSSSAASLVSAASEGSSSGSTGSSSGDSSAGELDSILFDGQEGYQGMAGAAAAAAGVSAGGGAGGLGGGATLPPGIADVCRPPCMEALGRISPSAVAGSVMTHVVVAVVGPLLLGAVLRWYLLRCYARSWPSGTLKPNSGTTGARAAAAGNGKKQQSQQQGGQGKQQQTTAAAIGSTDKAGQEGVPPAAAAATAAAGSTGAGGVPMAASGSNGPFPGLYMPRLPTLRSFLSDYMPAVAMLMVVVTASSKTAANAQVVVAGGADVSIAVCGVLVAAAGVGFLMASAWGSPTPERCMCAIQACQRNPALGALLAVSLFNGQPLVAAPCVVAIFAQNLLGAWLSVITATSIAQARQQRRIAALQRETQRERESDAATADAAATAAAAAATGMGGRAGGGDDDGGGMKKEPFVMRREDALKQAVEAKKDK